MSEHQPTGQHVRLMTSSEWSTVPAPGTRVLLTGAAGGLGRALSAALSEAGAEVVGIDLPGTRATVTADLTDDDSARRAVADTVDRLGGLDAVIGAAGVVDTIHRAETFPLKEFRGDIEADWKARARTEEERESGVPRPSAQRDELKTRMAERLHDPKLRGTLERAQRLYGTFAALAVDR